MFNRWIHLKIVSDMRTPAKMLLSGRRLAVTLSCAQKRAVADSFFLSSVQRCGRLIVNHLRDIVGRYGSGPISRVAVKQPHADYNGSRPRLGGWSSKLVRVGVDGVASRVARGVPVQRLVYGSKQTIPLLAFVGVTLASGKGFMTERDQMDSLCEQIRESLGRKGPDWSKDDIDNEEIVPGNLEDIQIDNKIIGKGCNAVVVAARWSKNKNNSMPMETSLDFPASELKKPFNGYNLAMKMMFNYDAESNAPAILKAMFKEIIPAPPSATIHCPTLRGNFNKSMRSVPVHRNIIDIQSIFTDNVIFLPGAMKIYPDALPRRLNMQGSGRNKTLYIVMPRYHCNMAEYLARYVPPSSTRLILLTQLLEGVAHLVKNQVAHRDLKADNLLLDLTEGLDMPHLVISDFGCCLADKKNGLKLPYYTEETDRGGNLALMAPEVACAMPNFSASIDYSKADLWAVGALAYEIWGYDNPFYVGKSLLAPLDSEFYTEDQLPELSVQPDAINRLVMSLLQRNPQNRPTAAVAATVCQLLLFGPKEFMTKLKFPSSNSVMEWLVNLAAVTLCQMHMGPAQKVDGVEFQLRFSFLRRATLEDITCALPFIRK